MRVRDRRFGGYHRSSAMLRALSTRSWCVDFLRSNRFAASRGAERSTPGPCLCSVLALPSSSPRAEDTALLRSNRSAVPGAKTEERADGSHAAARPSPCPLRDWPQCDKPSRHDAATSLTGGPSPLANARRSKFQFTVNQDTLSRMRSLRLLTVRGTHVTQGGVERLNRHVLDVVIHWW